MKMSNLSVFSNFQIKFHERLNPVHVFFFIKRAVSFKMSLELSSFFVSFFDFTAALHGAIAPSFHRSLLDPGFCCSL